MAPETPFDLRFPMGRIPVRVVPTFWLVAALLGWQADRPDLTLIWVGCVFVSILFHELGHALMAEWFGYPTEIVLYHWGGYAAFLPVFGWNARRSLLISLAGPVPQFLLGAVIWLATPTVFDLLAPRLSDQGQEYLQTALLSLIWCNCAWAVFNLLPVLPMDGGQCVRALMQIAQVRQAERRALQVSLVVGGLLTVWLLQSGVRGPGIMLLLLTLQNLQSLQRGEW